MLDILHMMSALVSPHNSICQDTLTVGLVFVLWGLMFSQFTAKPILPAVAAVCIYFEAKSGQNQQQRTCECVCASQ